MEQKDNEKQMLLLHIDSSKPIDMNDFTRSLNAFGSLFTSFANKQGYGDMNAKLYISKIQEGSIDIIMDAIVGSASCIPFIEQANVFFEFVSYLNTVKNYILKHHKSPDGFSYADKKAFHDSLDMVTKNEGVMNVCTIQGHNVNQTFNNCNFITPNGTNLQEDLGIEMKQDMIPQTTEKIFRRELLELNQISDKENTRSNKGTIGNLHKKELVLFFDSEELKQKIIHCDANPLDKCFLVDVIIQELKGKPFAYKIVNLHEIVSID